MTNYLEGEYNPFHSPPKKPSAPQHRYLFKALWGGTALKFWIEAKNELQAHQRAERHVLSMEGGVRCLGLELIQTIHSR